MTNRGDSRDRLSPLEMMHDRAVSEGARLHKECQQRIAELEGEVARGKTTLRLAAVLMEQADAALRMQASGLAEIAKKARHALAPDSATEPSTPEGRCSCHRLAEISTKEWQERTPCGPHCDALKDGWRKEGR